MRSGMRHCRFSLGLRLRAFAACPGSDHRPARRPSADSSRLQGSVELQRAGGKDWEPVKRLDTSLCAGDRLRTDALSRAALFVQPETFVRVDQNTTITLNQSNDEIEVEFFACRARGEAFGTPSPAARATSSRASRRSSRSRRRT